MLKEKLDKTVLKKKQSSVYAGAAPTITSTDRKTDGEIVQSGPFQWNEWGVTKDRSSLVLQWQGNELNLVFPTGEFEGVKDFIYPKPAM